MELQWNSMLWARKSLIVDPAGREGGKLGKQHRHVRGSVEMREKALTSHSRYRQRRGSWKSGNTGHLT